jgi:hypothetical protein
MVSIHVEKHEGRVVLAVEGLLDGSAAWRLVRLAHRLGRGRHVHVDLRAVARLLGFGAAVLARGRVQVVAARPEHRRVLLAEGVQLGEDGLAAEPAA